MGKQDVDIFLDALVRDNPGFQLAREERSKIITRLKNENALSFPLTVSKKELNKIISIPPEIKHLTQLHSIYLRGTQLTSLPPEIGELQQLKSLYLRETPLISLPSEIAQLQQLHTLDLTGTKITTLQPQLGNLFQTGNGTYRLFLPDTIQNVPQEILDAHDPYNPKPMLEYLRSLNDKYTLHELPHPPNQTTVILSPNRISQTSQSPRPLNQAKVIFVGHGTVGKTSLVEQLIHQRWNPNEAKTDRIEITSWPMKVNQQIITLHLWDFGGQEIMHATHQLFLTNRSLYLVVVDSRSNEIAEHLKYWLSLVRNLAPEAPILIIVNKIDQHRQHIDHSYWQKEFPAIQGWVYTSCATGAGIDTLQAAIHDQIATMPHIHNLLSKTWWDVKQAVEQHSEAYISFDQFLDLCRQHNIPEYSTQTTLLKLLHDIGICLHFPDYGPLAQTVVLDPSWVINAIYAIVNDKTLLDKHGIFQINDLDRILPNYPAHKYDFIVQMMQRFELCVQLDKQHWLVPDLMPETPIQFSDWDNSLKIVYSYPTFPRSIITRLLIRVFAPDSAAQFWNRGVILNWGEHRVLVQAVPEQNEVQIVIGGAQDERREVLHTIRHFLEGIHRSYKGIRDQIDIHIPVPGHPEILLDYKKLCIHEKAGRTTYFVEELFEDISIPWLLNGYGVPTQRHMLDKDVEHIHELITTNKRRLKVLQGQATKFGALHVPAHIIIEIEDLLQEITELKAQVRKNR